MQTPNRSQGAIRVNSRSRANGAASLRRQASYRRASENCEQDEQDTDDGRSFRHRGDLSWEVWAIGAIYVAGIVNALILVLS